MARLLSCPHCRAEFAFEDWARAASCPACGKRLTFFEASAQAAPPDAGGGNAAASSPSAASGAGATWAASDAPVDAGTPRPAPRAAAAPAFSSGPLAQASEVWDPLPEVRPALSVAPADELVFSSTDTEARSLRDVGDVVDARDARDVSDARDLSDARGAGDVSDARDPSGPAGTLGSGEADRESAKPAELWTWSAPDGASLNVDDAALFAGHTSVPVPPLVADVASPVAVPLAAPASESAVVPADVPAAAPAAEPAVAPASYAFATPPAGDHRYTLGGKALQWSRGWTVLVVVWAIVAVALVVTRVDMGRLTVMTPGETAAIAAVRQIRLPTDAPTETVLRYAATHDLNLEGHLVQIKPPAAQMWYAFDRSWEHRIYVYYELPGVSLMGTNVDLSWSVTNGVATASAATRVALAKAAQTMAHPPSPNSVRPIPGIIPSLPPDLQ